MSCDCRLCVEGRKFRTIANKLSVKDRKFMVDFYDYYMNIDADLDYHRCILNGSWPSSVSILTKALEEARKKQAPEGRA